MPVHFLDRLHRPASGRVAIGIVLEVSLEDGFDHDLGGGLNHTITNGRNAERTLATIRFGDHHPPHRIGSVCLRDQFRAQARQPCFQALLLDASKRHPIHTRCTRINAGEPIGVDQDVLATDLVVEQIEAEGGLRLGFAVELSLKAPDFIRRCQAHHQSPSPHHLQKRTRSRGPLLRRHYPASTLLLPRPTPAVTAAEFYAEAATLVRDGSPPITRTTLPTCRTHYPGGSRGCACRLLPHTCGLPQMTGGSASALELSRPAQASLCYGPSDRSAAQGRFRRRAPTQPVTRPGRLPASGPIDNYPGEILPH